MELFLTEFPSIFFFPMELMSAIVVFAWPLERRRYFAIRVFLCVLATIVMIGVCACGALFLPGTGIMDSLTYQEGFLSSLAWCSLLFAVMVLILWAVMDISLREAVYCGTCAYLLEHMVYCLRLILPHISADFSADAGEPLYFLIMSGVYVAGYFFFVRPMIRDRHYATTAMESLWLLVSVLMVVLVMSVLASAYSFELLHGIYALICCTFALVGQVKQQKQLGLQQELSLQQQLWQRHKAQLEMSQENIEIINRKCHDLKHQVAALKLIHDVEKQNQVIDSLQESVMIYDSILKTGNEVLDTVLTEKSLLCGQKDIALTCIADGALLSFLDAVDLYTLFGNALDNAIEATQQLPREDRMIDLQVRLKVGLILICITNRFTGTVEMGENLPKTNKEDKYDHGFGLRSIQAVAEKYDGVLTIKTENTLFRLQVVIPVQR